MTRNVNSLIGYAVLATDGEVGKIDDLYFDNKTWSTAYVGVRVSTQANRGRVFLPPTALGKPDWERQEFPVVYSKRQVMNAPDFDLGTRTSREEGRSGKDEGWVPIWMPSPEVGLGIMLMANSGTHNERLLPGLSLEEDDPFLQSANDMKHFRLHTTDGKIGFMDDLIIDDSAWVIRYLIIHTARWQPGRKVLVEPRSINAITRFQKRLYTNLSMIMLRESPRYDPPMPIGREYEARLQEYYEL